MKTRIAILLGSTLVAAWLTPAAHADQAAINALIGKTWRFTQGGKSGVTTYRSSSVTVKWSDGKTINGKLRVKGDQICTTYKEMRGGKEGCFGASKSGNGYKTTNGAVLTPG